MGRHTAGRLSYLASAACTCERVVVPRTRVAHVAHGGPFDDASSLAAHNYGLVMACILHVDVLLIRRCRHWRSKQGAENFKL
jgi:hypothetical protein